MESQSQVMECNAWIREVKLTIRQDWLKIIENNWFLNTMLKNILIKLHSRYHPESNGIWAANPKWTEMFQWTSCPFSCVNAVILTKGPNFGKPNKNSDFESTGMACGVRRKSNLQDWQLISTIPTVWNMLQIALLMSSDRSHKPKYDKQFNEQFHNGFNPNLLSENGILFLNVALTSAHKAGPDDIEDVKIWEDFTLRILREIHGLEIPLFQWYITNQIKYWLDRYQKEGKFVVSKPNALCMTYESFVGERFHQHICGFDDSLLAGYANELSDPIYEKHRDNLSIIFDSLVYESHKLSYRHGSKRKYNEECYQPPLKIKASPRY